MWVVLWVNTSLIPLFLLLINMLSILYGGVTSHGRTMLPLTPPFVRFRVRLTSGPAQDPRRSSLVKNMFAYSRDSSF